MDRRWPWKKKSSDKVLNEKTEGLVDSSDASNQKSNYVQISVESYKHLSELEDQVKSYEEKVKTYDEQVQTYEEKVQTLEDEIKEMNEKLSVANSEINTKESMVKQHAKVAEEAVSGWEKAEAEALALKDHLESVTLSKLTVEDRASHLDGALKECMRQIRNLKEEHEQKIQKVALSKTKQLDKIKGELEANIASFEQKLRRSVAENGALSRSLQERSNMLIQISEEKAHAEAEVEQLKSNVELCEREINSLKYELHVSSKELEIRNEEKNMSMRSAEAANKQHMEGVKKIAKLEAECQRLRGLVRKKLPGPAALAQMKLEVENLGRDYGESRLKKSPVKPASPNPSPLPEFSLENVQNFQKENEFLTERLFAMEEETKMLKEALAKRNSELQASRSTCAKTLSKLQSLEAQHQNGSPKSIMHVTHESIYSHNASIAPSLVSMSEDGNDDAGSVAESWTTTMASGPSPQITKKCTEESSKSETIQKLELMDDFLEVEKLARLSIDSNIDATVSLPSNNKETDGVANDISQVSTGNVGDSNSLPNQVSSGALTSAPDPQSNVGSLLTELRSRILLVFESIAKDTDIGKIVEDIKHVLDDSHDTAPSEATCDRQNNPEDAGLNLENETISSLQRKEYVQITSDLEAAISHIHDFVLLLGKEAIPFHDVSSDGNVMSQKIEEFSVTFNKVLCSDASMSQFVLELSYVLAKASELRFSVLGYKGTEAETNSLDCIDKIALPENKLVQENSSGERYQNGCSRVLNPDFPDDGNLVSGYNVNMASQKLSSEEFEELKLEKEKVATDLSICAENLEATKSQLLETEQLLAEVKSQLVSAQSSNSLAETQLKCMTESYKSLETRAQEFEAEANRLQSTIETLENELQEEKKAHKAALEKSKEFEEQLLRIESLTAENDIKSTKERDLAAAAEKLAECQETIFLLGKQLNAIHPQSPNSQEVVHLEMNSATSSFVQRLSSDSPLHFSNGLFVPSDNDSNIPAPAPAPARSPAPLPKSKPKHRPTKSASSTGSVTTPEKHGRGFSRFFSSKGKPGY
ncbi:filament-like plant protein 4 isoform X2 [Vicia villosa]|uniref:filament-like plant protein 4 isoform X2 n=1 Tax=Vicia villosa TaxID=3911 RepID=UPI00273CD990|nr:filament-like plant protein 4 isoform X2 [Vicia villosa]